MNLLKSLFRRQPDPTEALRPLWHRVVILSRDPAWYRDCGMADTVQGRFDMITLVLAMVLLRMEREEALRPSSTWLTELFVADMDGQLREFGVNDVVVGKRIGKLMSVLGGRLGTYRGALNAGDLDRLTSAVQRNVTFAEGADEAASAKAVAERLLTLSERLARFSDAEMIKASAIW